MRKWPDNFFDPEDIFFCSMLKSLKVQENFTRDPNGKNSISNIAEKKAK